MTELHFNEGLPDLSVAEMAILVALSVVVAAVVIERLFF